MNNKKFYITTPIYYANGAPHIGHFLTTTIADTLARYNRIKLGSENVFFTTGLDEHGTTVEQSAIKEGYKLEDFQEYVNRRAIEWQEAFDTTNISYDYFVRTTHPKHKKFAQDFIKKMVKNGKVYKGIYKGKYCNGCEKFLTLSDLDEKGLCPLHRPDQVIEVEEDNYFFRLSEYADRIYELITKDVIEIKPKNKKKEMLARLEKGIDDISISRPKEKVEWGVGFPGDSNQTVYVWVEALINYLSSLEICKKEGFWQFAIHLVGKDINWFHNVIWPAMLLSADYPLYKSSFVHGFLNISGQKISKSLGNIITPQDLLKRYGADGARYLILTNLPYKNDSDVTWDLLTEKYNADLANGLGNTAARITRLVEKSELDFESINIPTEIYTEKWLNEKPLDNWFQEFQVHRAIEAIWQRIAKLDKHINENEPWGIKDKEKLKEILQYELNELRMIAGVLEPVLPETSQKLKQILNGPKIKGGEILFPRIE